MYIRRNVLNHDWTYFFGKQCIDDQWAELEAVIRSAADRHCPLKQFNERKALRPWVTSELLELLTERDHLYKEAKSLNTDLFWRIAHKARNLCNTAVKNA